MEAGCYPADEAEELFSGDGVPALIEKRRL
jgi:hypothetical protein